MSVAPWVNHRIEWLEIRDERLERSITEWRTPDEKGSTPNSSSEVEHRSSTTDPGQSCVGSYSYQTQCPLFRLPIELRFAIWTDVVGGNHVTVIRKANKLAHVVLSRDRDRLRRIGRIRVLPKPAWGSVPIGDEERVKADEITAEVNLLALPRTCKWIYREVLPILYRRNSFEFSKMEALYRFLMLSPNAGLQAVQSLKVTWLGFAHWGWYDAWTFQPPLEHDESWKEICDAIVSMKGLRNLTFSTWLEFDICLPGLTKYDMVYRIVSPLKGLPERVSFTFAVPAVDIDEGLQARLNEDGCKNLRIAAIEGI
ncbi:hypothetical protein F5Y13DRAFT_200815 [Hypoxylon sp. FL1857]|nr:hypothetical protein F5Y13DRAFT_200815 [Hypoxylon sp. FL1857]